MLPLVFTGSETLPFPSIILLSVILLSLLVCGWFSLPFGGTVRKLPSGPPGDPIIGHIRVAPQTYAWKTFAEWAKKYGDVNYIHILGKSMVVLNSYRATKELFDKRGALYSDRPRFVLYNELMGWDTMLTFIPYGEKFRLYRRLINQHMNLNATTGFYSTQRAATLQMLDSLIQTPEQFKKHTQRWAESTMTMVVYGQPVTQDNDKYVHLVERSVELTVQAGSPGGSVVDFFPFLRFMPTWMPGAGFKRHALKVREALNEMLELPLEIVKQQKAINNGMRPSVMSRLLDEYEANGEDDPQLLDVIKAVGAQLYAGGTETSTTSLRIFLLAMVANPHVARKAQAEIDSAIGSDRLPTIDDRPKLPYIDCVWKEALRWNAPVPLGIPHRVTAPDTYEDKHIPGGSMVIANIWQMMRDERVYAEPLSFVPERYEGRPQEKWDDFDPRSSVFGFGRRICPGRHFADAGLWIVIACVLAAFDILPERDECGNDITPVIEFTNGFTSEPKDLRCRFVVRNNKIASVVRHELDILDF